MEKQIKGKGVFGWNSKERRSDRYGAFSLADTGYENNGQVSDAGWGGNLPDLEGMVCHIEVRVLEARESGHIGDMFRGISPTKPEVGEVVDLGQGTFFFEQWDYAVGVGLIPADGRESDWFDPHKLYRLHDQTVEVTITLVEE